MRDFAEVFLVAFPDHLARLKSRGTGMYESINGIHLHVSKFSEVQKADWVIALRLVEKALKGKIGLEMECFKLLSPCKRLATNFSKFTTVCFI